MTGMNTPRAIESLTRTGFSEEQARAVVGVVADGIDDRVVTKQDFGLFEAKIEAKLDMRLSQLETSIANAKLQMMLYTGAMVAGIAAVTRMFG